MSAALSVDLKASTVIESSKNGKRGGVGVGFAPFHLCACANNLSSYISFVASGHINAKKSLARSDESWNCKDAILDQFVTVSFSTNSRH